MTAPQNIKCGRNKEQYYDFNIEVRNGNPAPKGDVQTLVNKAQEMYHQLSKTTDEFFAFLRENIGKLMRVEFLIGTNNLVDRTGILIDVGASYILLRSLESDTITYCDIYSIKFITISNRRINNFMNNGYGGYNYY